MVKIVCAWCDKDMGTEEGEEDIRYSVCVECLKKFNITLENKKSEEKPDNK
jgi:hypothetical protein